MLRMCHAGQWSASDLDFSRRPRPMSREDEMAVVQYFTDMAQIERLAGALFVEQQRRVEDPLLEEIFGTFVKDEMRHSHVAQMLADHYDVHHYEVYRTSESLARFFPHFIGAIRHLSDDVANAYITAGELILDIALLRSIDDFVDDPLSAQAMKFINRDESRHIAIDYHMISFYAGDAYRKQKRKRASRRSASEIAAGAKSFAAMTVCARPFFRDVFFAPMQRIDPSGMRLREAFRRMQILGAKPGVGKLPLVRFWSTMLDLFNRPWMGKRAKQAIASVVGVEVPFLQRLATEEDIARARKMSFEELAAEALEAKLLH
jgi:hypothetical protein